MNIHDAHRGITKNKARRRLGRGIGSGQGKTGGRGHKGAGSRASWKSSATFEGGQMPIVRRIPKRGFTNKFALQVVAVNVGDLERLFEAGQAVDEQALRDKQLLKGRLDLLKVLGDGELTKSLKVSAHRFSKTALDKIQKAGGEAVVLPGRKPVVKNKMRMRKPQ